MRSTGSVSLRILVVADCPLVIERLVATLSFAGHQVAYAENGQQALEAVLDDCPDLLVSDWDVPRLNGVELCRKLRAEILPHYLYVLLLTDGSRVENIIRGFEAGADGFLSKPIVPALLLARLQAGARMLDVERRLRDLSRSDPLTGVMNRRSFLEVLQNEWQRTSRYRLALSCVMLDLDFFKRVNDTHGHAAGDAALKAVAKLLQNRRRPTDVVCRYGGEEFCVLLPETDEEGAACWADRTRIAISQARFPTADRSLQVTASFGVAKRLHDTQSAEYLIDMADRALLAAKESGRNRVVRFESLDDSMAAMSRNGEAEGPLDGLVARDVMTPIVVCAKQDDTVWQAADLFLQLRLSSAPVVDENGGLAGTVSINDLMMLTADGKGWQQRVAEVMKSNVVCYDENAPARKVFRFLSRVSLPRVVVVEDGRPTGIISRDSLLRWFRNWASAQQHGGADHAAAPPAEPQDLREGVLETAKALAWRGAELQRAVSNESGDLLPCVVSEATRLQELINDLLGHCRQSPAI